MTKQQFHTKNVLALEVEAHPASWQVNRLAPANTPEGLAEWDSQSQLDMGVTEEFGIGLGPGDRIGVLAMVSRPVPVEPGRTRVRYAHTSPIAGRASRIRLRWYDGMGTALWVTPWQSFAAGAGVMGTGVVTIPDYAHAVGVEVELAGPAGEYPAATGGDSLNSIRYQALWMSTAAEATAMGAANPPDAWGPSWTNVLPDASQLEVDRYVLDGGSLTARLPRAAYVPAGSTPLIRSGRRVRLRHLVTGERIFTGVIDDVDPIHHPERRRPEHRASVVFTAVTHDVIFARNEGGPRGTGRLIGASQMVRGSWVPWVVGGVSGTGSDVALNHEGSTLDQIVVARDTAGAHAWVDRNGRLQMWHAHQVPGVVGAYVPGDFARHRSTDMWSHVTNVGGITMAAAGWCVVTSYNPTGLVEVVGPGATDAHEVTPGETITITLSASAPAVARTPRLGLRWYGFGGDLLSSAGVDLSPLPADTGSTPTFQTRSTSAVVPANAAYVSVLVGFYAASGGGTSLRIQSVDIDSTNRRAATRTAAVSDAQYGRLELRTPRRANQIVVETARLGETTTHGPFLNHVEQSRRGVQAATIRTAPVTSNLATWAQRYAQRFMGRGAAPDAVRETTSLTIPILTSADNLADRDLYDTLGVLNSTLGTADVCRIVGVHHRITADPPRWLVTFDLADVSAPATPTVSA